uniref:uncharacterized protein LOC122604096 n=1 Tax=Erigeron canadensis TaxID=72917 RepID=UPI001CB9AE34|nr:uncharacterized protein LOC122604096 [Erigeron canadensis]
MTNVGIDSLPLKWQNLRQILRTTKKIQELDLKELFGTLQFKEKALAQNIRASTESRRHVSSSSAASTSANPLTDPLALISTEPIYPNDGASTSALPASFQALVEELDVEEKQEMFSDFVEFALIARKKYSRKWNNRKSVAPYKPHVDKSQEECWKCGRKGHYQKECRSIAPQPLTLNMAETFKRSTVAVPYDYSTPQRADHTKQQPQSISSNSFPSKVLNAEESQHERLMVRRVRFGDARFQQESSSQAKSVVHQQATHSSPPRSILRHPTPQRGKMPQSVNRPTTPQRGCIPQQQMRNVTPQRGNIPQQRMRSVTPQLGNVPQHQIRSVTLQSGHLPHQQVRSSTPNRGQLSSQQIQSSITIGEYLPHRQGRSATPNRSSRSTTPQQSSSTYDFLLSN